MNPSSFPLLSQFLLFVFGIYLSFPTDWFSIGFGLALALVTLLYFAFQPPWYSRNLLIGSCFLLLGVGLGKIDQQLTEKHYSQFITTKGQNTFEFILEQRLRPTAYYDRYTIQIKKCNGQRTDGHLLLTVAKDSTQKPLDYGQAWKLSGRINPIAPPLNPGQFDYKSYLNSLGIYHQLKSTTLPTPMANPSTSIFLQSKARAIAALERSILTPPTKQLLNALVLGEKTALDREEMEGFAQAGLAHLLAISGLHIGLLMLLFRFLLWPLRLLPKGNLLLSLTVISLLWGYAFFVGASPSVLRAVTLFSAIQLGHVVQRKLPTAYLVLLSMVILLFASPRLILQLGFQLSYLAVFGILFLLPIFQLNISFPPFRWFWSLTLVSLAAQIAVAPLSIYHFQQFPALFLLSNWVVLPLIGAFLYLGFGSVIWLLFSPLPQVLVKLLDSSVYQLNLFVQWVNQQEAFFFSNLYLSKLCLLLCYLLLIGLLLGHYSKKSGWFYCNCSVALALFYSLWTGFPQKQDSLWLAHRYGSTLLVEKKQQQLFVYTNDSLAGKDFTLGQYQRYFGLKDKAILPLKNGYQLGQQQLLVIDGDWIKGYETSPATIILLCNNPKFNVERYLKKQRPQIVLIDGSNTPYYIERWKQTLTEEKIPYHVTAEQGAFNFNRETWE